MYPLLAPHLTLVVIGAMFLATMFGVRVIQPRYFRSRPVRWLVTLTFGVMMAGVALWLHGRHVGSWPHITRGAGIAYVGILVFAPAAALVPFTATADRLLGRQAPAKGGEGLTRRGLLRAGVSALPLAAAATSGSGFASAKMRPRLPVVTMQFPDLHPDLEGFRILHLSDIHLGEYVTLDDLRASLAEACAAATPDLVVFTGDLAEDLTTIPEALEIIASTASKHGAFASLGNHEYLPGIQHTRPHFEASRVPLLVSSGRTVDVGGAKLFVAGADDPVHFEGDIAGMVRPSIARAAKAGPRDADLRLLLCHRPEGLGPAADHGFDLVLSGHTHGGQLGLFGRSVFELLRPGTGWWGRYEKKRASGRITRQYTTSGFGHWFPFRLGCPTELPIVVLERAPSGARIASRPV